MMRFFRPSQVLSGCLVYLSRNPVSLCTPTSSNARAHYVRHVHSQAFTPNFLYISNDNVKLKIDLKTMKLEQDIKKPLCIIMNWMLARPNHVMKYAALYLEQGFDIISVSCTPWQLMWPVKGSQIVGRALLDFMAENNHLHMVMHGFSVGAYVWGEGLIYAMMNKDKYQPAIDRVRAQVWDSAADIPEIPVGFPSAVFPKNMFLQKALRSYTKYHLKTFYKIATVHYEGSSDIFHQTPCRAPALFLLSKTDPVGSEGSNRGVHDCWVKLGVQCTWMCWDRSPHVLHYFYHPKEYLTVLYEHLDKNGLITNHEKMNARLAAA